MDTKQCTRCCYYEQCTKLGRTATKECINRSRGKTLVQDCENCKRKNTCTEQDIVYAPECIMYVSDN